MFAVESLPCSKVDSFLIMFFKQKTAYEMRFSDWSSDVCSSVLAAMAAALTGAGTQVEEREDGLVITGTGGEPLRGSANSRTKTHLDQIGRASWRDRGWQYG